MVQALVAGQVEKSNGLLACSIKEVEPEPTSYTVACQSQYSEVWKKSMEAELADLVAAGAFSVVLEVPNDFNIVQYRWVYKWKGNAHGEIERAEW